MCSCLQRSVSSWFCFLQGSAWGDCAGAAKPGECDQLCELWLSRYSQSGSSHCGIGQPRHWQKPYTQPPRCLHIQTRVEKLKVSHTLSLISFVLYGSPVQYQHTNTDVWHAWCRLITPSRSSRTLPNKWSGCGSQTLVGLFTLTHLLHSFVWCQEVFLLLPIKSLWLNGKKTRHRRQLSNIHGGQHECQAQNCRDWDVVHTKLLNWIVMHHSAFAGF